MCEKSEVSSFYINCFLLAAPSLISDEINSRLESSKSAKYSIFFIFCWADLGSYFTQFILFNSLQSVWTSFEYHEQLLLRSILKSVSIKYINNCKYHFNYELFSFCICTHFWHLSLISVKIGYLEKAFIYKSMSILITG